MASEFQLSIVAPDREILDQMVASMIAPGSAGYFGVYAGHEAMVIELKPGLVEYQESNGTKHFVTISGGFAEVTQTRVTILADSAERAQEVDRQRAEASLEKARRVLRGEDGDMTQDEASAAAERAINRLRATNLAQSV